MAPRRWTDDELRDAWASALTIADICRSLQMVACGGNYEHIRRHLGRLGLDPPSLRKSRGDARTRRVREIPKEELLAAVPLARSLRQLLLALGVREAQRNYDLLRERLIAAQADTAHMVGRAWRRGSRTPVRPAVALESLLVIGSSVRTAELKRRLIAAGHLDERCEMCGLTEWNGEPISLELDHINGRREGNRLGNLRLLCPNCHAQTPTYRGRNIGAHEVELTLVPTVAVVEQARFDLAV